MFLKARENTKKYHSDFYKKNTLFKKGSWLVEPEKDALWVGEKLLNKRNIKILDLGCGVGRNVIPLAQMLQKNGVTIDCVDYLPIAIAKLKKYSKKYKVDKNIKGDVSAIEDFVIKKNYYDFITSHGVLDHLEDKQTLIRVLKDIASGVKKGGYVYLAITSEVKESDAGTKKKLIALEEIDLTADEVVDLYKKIFAGWKFEKIRKDFYEEIYERGNQSIDYKCYFTTLVAQKN